MKNEVSNNAGAPAKLTPDRIQEIAAREFVGGYEPHDAFDFARAIEREVLSAHAGVKAEPAAPVQTAVQVQRATLLMIYEAMNYMGDILNNMDACEEEDEEATTPAFDALRKLLDDSYVAAPVQAEQAQVEPVSIHCQEFHELAMDYRAAQPFRAHEPYSELVAYINDKLASAAKSAPALPTQAEQVAAVRAAADEQEHVMPPMRGTECQHSIGTDGLSGAIMNLTTKRTMSHFVNTSEMNAFKQGYFEARIDAAELATEFSSRFRAQGGNTSAESAEFATKEAAAQVPAAGWISVDDSVTPDEGQRCIVLIWPYDNHENSQIEAIADYIDGTFVNHEGDDMHPPSHWMPFPNIARPAAPSTTTSNDTSALGGTGGGHG